MNKLEKMRQIAARRTKGEWEVFNTDIEAPDRTVCRVLNYDEYPRNDDAEFIAMAANNIDQLIAVAEAAKCAVDGADNEHCPVTEPELVNLWKALRKLESNEIGGNGDDQKD